jgi:hypothetical protein
MDADSRLHASSPRLLPSAAGATTTPLVAPASPLLHPESEISTLLLEPPPDPETNPLLPLEASPEGLLDTVHVATAVAVARAVAASSSPLGSLLCPSPDPPSDEPSGAVPTAAESSISPLDLDAGGTAGSFFP